MYSIENREKEFFSAVVETESLDSTKESLSISHACRFIESHAANWYWEEHSQRWQQYSIHNWTWTWRALRFVEKRHACVLVALNLTLFALLLKSRVFMFFPVAKSPLRIKDNSQEYWNRTVGIVQTNSRESVQQGLLKGHGTVKSLTLKGNWRTRYLISKHCGAYDKEVPGSILGKTNFGNNVFLVVSGLGVLRTTP